MPPKEHTATVISNKEFKDNNYIITFKTNEKMDFEAGQFIMLHNDTIKRAFSIASPPSQENIDILLKHNKNGKVSPLICNLKEGEKLTFTGPLGAFKVKETGNELVFISAGTGIAPFRSMIIDTLEKSPDKKITLIFGFRHDFFFESDFRDLEKKHPKFKLVCSCTKPESSWEGKKGRITEHIQETLPSPDQKEVYICGPNQMIESTKKILLEKLNFKEDQIHIEKWG